MFGKHFYHQHTRRAVTVFGTLFNNIQVHKTDGSGKVLSQIKVPLSYGPRQKFLSRIRGEENLTDPRLAIKLPRMSFEIDSFSYDESTSLTRGTKYMIGGSTPQTKKSVFYPATYKISFTLSIMGVYMDDMLQILEQILPYFQPEYTVTVSDIDGRFKYDMPFVLNSVTNNDDYEGDYQSRRVLLYTLTFETRVRYYGPVSDDGPIIRSTRVSISDMDTSTSESPYWQQRLIVSPPTATEDDEYTILSVYDPMVYESAILGYDSISGSIVSGERVSGNVSGVVAIATTDSDGQSSISVTASDGVFEIGETVAGQSTGGSFIITSIQPIWNALEDE